MKLKNTANNLLGIKVLKVTKDEKGNITTIPHYNSTSFTFFKVVHIPNGIHEEYVRELGLNNSDRIFIISRIPKSDLIFKSGQELIHFISPDQILGYLDDGDDVLFNE